MPSWGLSDLGYPVFVGIVYSIFPSMIFLKIVQAMLLGFIGILTFRITINVSNRETAKLAAILVAFFPIFHWFTGNTLKEIVMTFLILISIEKIILILNGKLNLKGAILLGLVLVSLFTFRSAIAVILTVTLVGSIIFTRKGGIKTLILGLILMLTIFLSILSLGEGDAIIRMVQDRSTAFEASQQQFLSRGQSIANILSVPLSIASVAIAPLPSYVEIPVEYNEYNIHGKWYFSGGLFLKNCLAFFSIIGMFFLVKKRLKSSFPLFIFTFSYWYVLALAGLFTSTRYQLPTIPFTLIFAAIALTNLPKKSLQYYLLYLILLVPVIIFWNYIQIQGRGIIN